MPGLPAALRHAFAARPRAAWAGRLSPRGRAAVTALLLGDRCRAVRVEAGDERPRLVDAAEGSVAELAHWRAAGLFRNSRAMLVLPSSERHVLTLDRPNVPAAELPLAVRWPLGSALEVEPDALLSTAVEMPRINEAAPAQVLAFAAPLAPVRAQLATLRGAGIDVRSIDVTDSALRGMRALLPADNDGWVVLATIGNDLCIALLWHGRFCALRTIGLPLRRPRDTEEFDGQLALHIQRTTDGFERQARQLVIRQVLAALPALSLESRSAVQAALPLPSRLLELGEAFEVDAGLQARCAADGDLTALACVAAARLLDPGPAS